MKVYVKPEEVALIEQAASNLRDRLLVRLLFYLGCRVSEALGLATDDIDFSQGTVIIEHLKTRLQLSCPQCGARLGKSHAYCPKCGIKVEKTIHVERECHRTRTLPVDSQTLDMLKGYVQRGGPIPRNGKNLIFDVSRHRGYQIVKECAERAGLPKLVNPETGKVHNVSPHRLRDAFSVHAAQLDDSSDGLRILQEHLGYRSFNTTARYRKVASEEHRQWYDKLWSEDKP